MPPGGLGTALLHKRVVAGGPWDKLASAKRRQRPATTLPRSVAAARAQRAVPVLGGKRKLWKFLVYYGEVVPNPILGGHSDGADRASKKATECQLLFFGASVSTFDFRLPSLLVCPPWKFNFAAVPPHSLRLWMTLAVAAARPFATGMRPKWQLNALSERISTIYVSYAC